MENAYLILAILALLFISMYGYSYIPVILESKKLKQLKIEQAELEEEREQDPVVKRDLADDKLSKSLKRSAEIRRELHRLEQMKMNKMSFLEDELNQMKVEKMKKQQVS